MRTNWTIIESEEALGLALTLCRGAYQEALLRGGENLSCSTLTGTARDYKSSYQRSQRRLLDRMSRAGIIWREEIGDHGARLLVLVGVRDDDPLRLNDPDPYKPNFEEVLRRAWDSAICTAFGHDLVDVGTGGPDSGNMDHECRRCGAFWRVPLY